MTISKKSKSSTRKSVSKKTLKGYSTHPVKISDLDSHLRSELVDMVLVLSDGLKGIRNEVDNHADKYLAKMKDGLNKDIDLSSFKNAFENYIQSLGKIYDRIDVGLEHCSKMALKFKK